MTDDYKLIMAHIEHLRMQGRAGNTIRSRQGALSRAARAIPVPLHQATENHIITWRAGRHGADMYVISEVSHIRSFYDWAVTYGHLPASPARRIPVPPVPDYEPRPISLDDLLAAIDGAHGRMRIWLVLAAFAGMRACEVAALRRSCVRERDAEPHIIIRADATKGKRHGRRIALCDFAVAEICDARLPSSGWCFPRLDGQPGHITPHGVSNLANPYLHDECGIADTYHSLRHFYGTWLLDGTGNLRIVQDQMGHLSIQTTTKYTKVSSVKAAEAAATLPDPRNLRRAGLDSGEFSEAA